MNLMDKCCEKCTHTADEPCPDFIACRTRGPLCHSDDECRARKLAAVEETLYGKGGLRVTVGTSTCGLASGAQTVYDALKKELSKNHPTAKLVRTGCMGSCYAEVMVEIEKRGSPSAIYSGVTPDKVEELLDTYLGGSVAGAFALRTKTETMMGEEQVLLLNELPFFKHQERNVIRNCGVIDPKSIEEYIVSGGYAALSKVMKEMTPEKVIEEVSKSRLRGRGGAGFPAGLKWKLCRQVQGDVKYMICNADEGDPGAFMNRLTAEGDPHKVIEGLIIAAYAIGASEGYIFVRAEKPLMAEHLTLAITEAKRYGLLGENILGSGFSLEVKPMLSAGAFVCGEETAMMAAIEGKRAMPRPRPPFPATKGLWDKPTTINNVETLAHIPAIIVKGAEEYTKVGTEKSKGTKVYCLAGKVARTGAAEVPIGMSLRQLIFDIGGGVPDGKRFKAVQIGGPSGGCLPESRLDLPLDYESLQSAGAIMGSGGIIVLDEDTCIVDLARYFLNFTTTESCGKCTPCRVGLQAMLEVVERITEGEGNLEDIETLQRLSKVIADSSLCALGRTAPNPVTSTLMYFRDEYDAHITGGTCPSHLCKHFMKRYTVDAELCKGCELCAKECLSGAISFTANKDAKTGKTMKKASINAETCIKCGRCESKCPFGAIKEEW
ncbi:MAG TPA: NADH-quinone oxidoreductase subunit NuoF [Candidatus Desulfaltia sp.]|nr:NADH-quinone oxidoreductase subunit NuoF [Candidatus Desulfaltia sp.]